MSMGWWWVALAGAMGEALCVVPGRASADFLIRPRYEVRFIPHALRGACPSWAPSLAALSTSVRYEKTYRASQRTNHIRCIVS